MNPKSSAYYIPAIFAKLLTLFVLIVSLTMACASSVPDEPVLILSDHSLVGKIWDVKHKRYLDQQALLKKILASEYVLLGEQHDNRIHHQHQSWVIRQLHQNNRQVSVAFEMIDTYQASRLDKREITSVEQLIEVLNQFKTSWKYESRYKELFAEVIAAGYQIDAANLNRQRLMHTARLGNEKLPAAYRKILEQTPFTDQQTESLQQEIKESHCNMLDDKTSHGMILGQRLRDVIMTNSLLQSQQPVKVLIAGAGHVRNDRGVPLYLAGQDRKARILAIGFTEVREDGQDIASYTERWDSAELPFDIVWFTPQVERENLCAELRKHFRKEQ